MPAPPPIQMAVPEPSPVVPPTRGRALQLPAAPAPLPDDPAPEPADDAAVPQSGPARLYIGPPRAVAPVMVRAGLDERSDISDGPEVRPSGDGTEFRFALPRGDRVPVRAKGMERGTSTVVATPERRVWTEPEPEAEAPPSREVIRLDNAARPRPGPLEPPLRRPVASEVIGVPEERDLPHDHPPVEAPGVNLADDGFFERQGVPSARLPDRALQPPLPPVRTASRKFVPRTPPPRRSVPAWAWALTGVVLLVAGLAGTWSRIRGEIARAERPPGPSVAAEPLPAEATSNPDTLRVPGGEEEPRVEVPPAEPPPVEAPPVDPTPVATPPVEPVPVASPPVEPTPSRAEVESPLRLVGVLRVVSNVSGKIYIDGKYKAAIDEEVVLELPAGVHDVKLVPRHGRAQTQKVRVDAGEARGVVFQVK